MYGIVNLAIEDFIVSTYGDEVWNEICAKALTQHIPTFVTTERYPDEVTIQLVLTASQRLGLTPDALLHRFGKHWVAYMDSHGYGHLLSLAGSSFGEFIVQIDVIHAQAMAIMPDLQAPTMDVERMEEEEEEVYLVHYRSTREGLAPLVTGLLEGVAARFGQTIEIQHQERTSDGADHDIFITRVVDSNVARQHDCVVN